MVLRRPREGRRPPFRERRVRGLPSYLNAKDTEGSTADADFARFRQKHYGGTGARRNPKR